MDLILVKILAAFLALSQVVTRPEAIKTHFDAATGEAEVVTLMRAGCAHMRNAFDIESIDLDGLISTALDDPQAVAGEIKVFRGLNFANLHAVYRQLCKTDPVDKAVIDVAQVIEYFNKAAADLPDPARLKGLRLSGTSAVLDAKGGRFAEVYEGDNRRVWVPLSEIPDHVQKAFVAAEDKRFFQHAGIDERGLIRAMVENFARPGRPQGGSTITQQVVKNLVVGDDVTYERKIREMIVAARVEKLLTKQEILELYLNSIYLGRGSWGVELAARGYFGKSASELTLAEGAQLAGLTKGPNYFNPDRHPQRAKERLAYVLSRMQEDGEITAAQSEQARAAPLRLVAYERVQRDTGYYVLDHINREARSLPGVAVLTTATSTVHSTIHPELQRAAEAALQEGLSRYELATGRTRFQGPEANLSQAIQRLGADPDATKGRPAWQAALEGMRAPLYDVHWKPAVIVQKGAGDTIRVGLADGRVLPLNGANAAIRRTLKLHDVVYVRSTEGKGKSAARADLRIRPTVQGAAVVLDNKTGGILAMVGGFSYPLSQINRVTQTQRQPGSAFKPFTYLAALHKGLQPNTLVQDSPITLPPPGHASIVRERDYWTPKNYDGGSAGVLTLRRALENSKNLVTARLLDGGIDYDPGQSLARVCELALEAQVYHDCVAYYPFVLGAQPVRLIDLAAFYASVANEGRRPTPHAIDKVEQNGKVVFASKPDLQALAGNDRVAFYQLKTMLQGVLARGTARAIAHLAPYVGGKTGTSDDENDAWFVGFTNDVTVGVWIGYDNADGKRRTLGGGQTGGKVAVPIFQSIIESVWANYAKKEPLAPPSPEAKRFMIALPIDLNTGDVIGRDRNAAEQTVVAPDVDRQSTGEWITDDRYPRDQVRSERNTARRTAAAANRGFTEWFRLSRTGSLDETQYQLVSQAESYYLRGRDPGDGEMYMSNNGRYGYDGPYGQYPAYGWQPPRPPGGLFGWFGRGYGRDYSDRDVYAPRRADPDVFWRRDTW
jgi:1A family penicillin-binding protein